MQILAIGNSFTQDSTAYLKAVADAAGEDMTVVNLYIGGCTLERHYRNMLSCEKIYSLEFNGATTGFFVSMEQALLSRDWDAVVIHQASRAATKYEYFQPYLNELAAFVRTCCPKTKLYMHQTWACEEGSEKLTREMGFATRADMYNAIVPICEQAAKDMDADGIIPSGTVMQKLIEKVITRLNRDSFHASLDIGRYALALTWFKALTGNSVLDNKFKCYVGEITPEQYETIKKCVEEIV